MEKKVNGAITEKYLWGNLTTLLAIYNADDTLRTRFEYADSRMPYKMIHEGQAYYLAYDQVGTLKAISTEDGTIVKTIEHDTFGNVLLDSNPNLSIPFGFAGGLYDPDTKLTRFGYRDYDAETGKWTAKDPIGFNGGDTNLYGYVLGDPVNLVDPEGLSPSFSNCLSKCIAQHYGIGAMGLAAGVSGLPIVSTRTKPGGATKGTSPLSSSLSKALPMKMPWSLPAPTRSLGTGARTAVTGRFLARWIPLLGWGLLSYDITTIAMCVNQCMNKKSCP